VISHRAPIVLAALLISAVPLGVSSAQQAPAPAPLVAPPGPVSRFPTRFTVTDAPEQFEQVLMVVDFGPDTWTPVSTPGGNVYNTVIEGEISATRPWMDDQTTIYRAGDTFVQKPGEYMAVGNTNDANARVITTALLPKGEPLFTTRQIASTYNYAGYGEGYYLQDININQKAPTTVHRSSVDVDRPTEAFELVHLVVDFEPGIWTPRHMHGGQELAMVVTGELTLQRYGESEIYKAGSSWTNTPGLTHAAGNDGDAFARAAATFLLPLGAALTTVQSAPPEPSAGRGSVLPDPDPWYLEPTSSIESNEPAELTTVPNPDPCIPVRC